jgi:Tfp pilus assembly protein PilX
MRLRHDERGFALITAMIVLAVFMTLAFAMVTIVDVQTHQTGRERSGEAAFNLAVSALQAEAYQLQLAWPATSAQALPACNQSTAQGAGCEGAALTQNLQTTTPGPDYAHATWSAQAFDNTTSAYSASLASSAPAWDANGDNSVWVRANATANGQTRTVVERVKRQLVTIPFPENLVTAGAVYTSNSGNKTIVNDSSSGAVGWIDVRCGDSTTTPVYGAGNCLGWDTGQLTPATGAYQAGYTDPTGTSSSLTFAQIAGLVATAAAAGTLYNQSGTTYNGFTAHQGCPPGPTAGVVVVAGTGTCSYTNNSIWNTTSAPGALIFLSGSVYFGGGTFNGVLYMANQSNVGGIPPACSLTAPPLVTIHSNAAINGAVYADGCGIVNAGDSAGNLNFLLSAVTSLQSYGAATPDPGTLRVVAQ